MALVDGTTRESKKDADASVDGRDVDGLEVLADLAVCIERYHRRMAKVLVLMVIVCVVPIVMAIAQVSTNTVGPAIMGLAGTLGMIAGQWRSVLLARGASVDALLRSAEIESMEDDERIAARVAGVILVVVGFATLALGSVQSWTGHFSSPMGGMAAVVGYGVVVSCLVVIIGPRFRPLVMSHEIRQASMMGIRLKGRGVDELAAAQQQGRYVAALRAWRKGQGAFEGEGEALSR